MLGREEIQGEYDLMLEFDVRDLDMEFVGKKLEYLEAVTRLDVSGEMDRAALVKVMVMAADPVLGAKLVRPTGEVRQKEVDDEKAAVAQMAAGVEPTIKDGGWNPQLRLQVLQETINGSPQLARRLQDENDPFRALVENRAQAFQFQMQQQENAQIGRIGVRPVQG